MYIQLNDGKNLSKMHTYLANWKKSPDPENCFWQLTKAVTVNLALMPPFITACKWQWGDLKEFFSFFFFLCPVKIKNRPTFDSHVEDPTLIFLGEQKNQNKDPGTLPLPLLLLFLIVKNAALAALKCGNSHFSAMLQTSIDSLETQWGANHTGEIGIFLVKNTAEFGNFPQGVKVTRSFLSFKHNLST